MTHIKKCSAELSIFPFGCHSARLLSERMRMQGIGTDRDEKKNEGIRKQEK